jgi:hypothetical protein
MVPFNYLHDPILKNAKIQSLCHLPLYLAHVTHATVSRTIPQKKLHHSHDELVIEILHPSPNTKCDHQTETK